MNCLFSCPILSGHRIHEYVMPFKKHPFTQKCISTPFCAGVYLQKFRKKNCWLEGPIKVTPWVTRLSRDRIPGASSLSPPLLDTHLSSQILISARQKASDFSDEKTQQEFAKASNKNPYMFCMSHCLIHLALIISIIYFYLYIGI